VLATALQLVAPFAGHIECLRVVPDQAAMIAQAVQLDMGSAMVLADSLASFEKQSRERTKRARDAFVQFPQTE
jgi:hypothetical protein